jgi:hypothetical protein
MHALSDTTLLQLWESGCAAGPVERALLLLGAARPALDPAACAEIDIGTRDDAILRLRQCTVDGPLVGSVRCPGCGERMRFEVEPGLLLPRHPPPPGPDLQLRSGRRFRLPTSADLIAVAQCPDEDDAAAELARRCRLGSDDGSVPGADDIAELDAALAALQAASAIELALVCAACGQEWEEQLDIGAFFWGEIESRARRLLDDVHLLAWSYGWSEGHILAMSRIRRAAYLARCEQ